MSDQIQPLLLRPADVATLLNISRTKAYELIAAGVIPSVKIGKSVRVSRVSLERWIASQETQQTVILR